MEITPIAARDVTTITNDLDDDDDDAIDGVMIEEDTQQRDRRWRL